jgi:glutamate--cysteine ligase catalytic subunit
VATPLILGTKDHILIEDPEILKSLEECKGDLASRNLYTRSQFTIDGTENPHPRFSGLAKSIRERRGEKVRILVPLYEDVNTDMTSDTEEYPGYIYMDSMHFGMGCSCLQVTFESQSLNHARYLHDMLLPFTPLLAALSQASPIFKGKMADIDLRWTVISQSVDCRTEEERDPESPNFIPKSRYSSMSHYISNHQYVKDAYFDTLQYKVDPAHLKILSEQGGLDARLAHHIGSLFVRDPVPTYDYEHLDADYDPKATTAHFENL